MPVNSPEDPVVRSARREAVVAVLLWLGAMAYTVGYCWQYAYNRPADQIRFIFGIPDWVLWGVALPWAACVGLSWWFAYGFMSDEPLGTEAEPPDDESPDDEPL